MSKFIREFIEVLNKAPQKHFTKAEIKDLLLTCQSNERFVKCGDVILDRSRNTIKVSDAEPIHVQYLVFKVLEFLIQNENEVINRETLLKEVWGSDVVVSDRSVDVVIWKLRQVLGERIHTIKKVGYMFNLTKL